jgi:chaperonin cofactor prefoldin
MNIIKKLGFLFFPLTKEEVIDCMIEKAEDLELDNYEYASMLASNRELIDNDEFIHQAIINQMMYPELFK